MSGLNAVMAILVVSCCNSPVFSEMSIQSKSYDFGNREVIVGKKSIDDTTFVYAVCDSTPDKRSADCSIKFESDVFDDSEPSFCDLNLASKLTNGKLDILEINLWGHDKAIFIWRDINQDNLQHTEVTINVVILENCDVKVHTFKADNRDDNRAQIFILPYKNSYDVAFMDSDLCGDFFCKVRVTIDGTVSPAVRWFHNISFVVAVEPTNDDSKTLRIQYGKSIPYRNQMEAYLLRDIGWHQLELNHDLAEAAWSTSNGYISLCSETICSIYYQNGTLIRTVHLLMSHNPTQYAIFYNLPNYQQLSLACTTALDGNYYIFRYNSPRYRIHSLPIEHLKCANKPKVLTGKFSIIRHGKYCLSLFFSDYTSPGVYKFHKYCFIGLGNPPR